MAYYAPVQNYRSNFGNAIAQGMGQVATGMQRGQDLAEQERIRQEENARREQERQQQLAMAGFKNIEDAMETHTPTTTQVISRPERQAPTPAPRAVVGEDGLPQVGAIQGASMGNPLQGMPLTLTTRGQPEQRLREGYSDIGAGLAFNPATAPGAISAAWQQQQDDEREAARLAEREAHVLGLLGDDEMGPVRAAMIARDYDPGALFGHLTPEDRRDFEVETVGQMADAEWPDFVRRQRLIASLREPRGGGGGGGGGAGGGNRGMTGGQFFNAMRESVEGDIRYLQREGVSREQAQEYMINQYGEQLGFPGVIRGLVDDHFSVGNNNITWEQAVDRATRNIAASEMATDPETGRKVPVSSLTPEQRRIARDIEAEAEFGGERPSARAIRQAEEAQEAAAREVNPDNFALLRETMANPTAMNLTPTTAFGNPFHPRGQGGAQAAPAAPQRPAISNYFSGRDPATVVRDSSRIIEEASGLPPETRVPLLQDVLQGLREVQGGMRPRTRQHGQIGSSIREVENAIESALAR